MEFGKYSIETYFWDTLMKKIMNYPAAEQRGIAKE